MASIQETAQSAINLYENGQAASLSDAIADSLSGKVDFEKISRVCEEANTSYLRNKQREFPASQLMKLSFETAKPQVVAELLSVDPAAPVYKHAPDELLKGPMKISGVQALSPKELPAPVYPKLVEKASSAPVQSGLSQDDMVSGFDSMGAQGMDAYHSWVEKASASQIRFVDEAERRILAGTPRANIDYIVFQELQKYSSSRLDMAPFATQLLQDLRTRVGDEWLQKQSAATVAQTLTPTLLGEMLNPDDLLVKLSQDYMLRMYEARRHQEALEHLLQRKHDYLSNQD